MENNKDIDWVDHRLAGLAPAQGWQPDVERALARFEQQRARRDADGRRWTWAAAAAAAALLGLLAFPDSRALAQRIWVPCRDACESLFLKTVGGARLPAAVVKTAKDRPAAPDFTLTGADGVEIRLSGYKGKVVMLNFWATWCTPCLAEIPWFVEFQRTHAARGLAVVGISMDEDGWKPVRPFMETQKINYPVAIGDDALAQKYGGIESLPETLLIDREGRIASRHVGIVARSDYEKELIQILDEK
jgi:peroxiredoxin